MTRIFTLFFAILLLSQYHVNAQVWQPTTSPVLNDRYDDIYFINADTGWAIYELGPYVIKTTDGGATWQKMDSVNAEFRDIAFLDANTGFIGLLNETVMLPDTTPTMVIKTTDGGITWQPVHVPTPANRTGGICGMRVINDSTVYAVGRYSGPAGFYKTTNRGNTWSYTSMSAYSGGLIDIFFFNPDTGFVCGSSGYFLDDSAVVLYTTDAGNTWQTVAKTPRAREWCWKLSFPGRMVGYASIEDAHTALVDSQYCLKTIDGGLTWQSVFVDAEPNGAQVDMEGIGFINDTVGWVGGRNSATGLNPIYTYKTTDGGLNWNRDYWGKNVNRFRFINDTLAYCAGQTVYKFATGAPAAVADIMPLPQLAVYPNPANTKLMIKYTQAEDVKMYNINGQLICDIKYPAANMVDISALAPGIYIAQITLKERVWNIKWEKQ